MPSRSSSDSVSVSMTCDGTRENGDQTSLISYVQSSQTWTNSVTFGENPSGWREKLRDGIDATTQMDGSLIDVRYSPGHISGEIPKIGIPGYIYKAEMVGTGQMNCSIPAAHANQVSSPEANAEALGRFVRRAYDAQHALMGGVIVGELGQTLRTIKNPAQGLRRLVDEWGTTARRIRGSKVYPLASRKRRVAENLADAWLEVQFGWRPLLNDIADGSKALDQYNTGQALTLRRITGFGERKLSPTESTSTHGVSTIFWRSRTTQHSYYSVRYRGAVRIEARNPTQMDPALLGFDLASWLPTAWELIPYSFLIDYFTNVGDVILGWSTLGGRVAWCSRTVRRHIELNSTTIDPVNMGNYVRWTHVPAKWICQKRNVFRTKFTGSTIPAFTWEIPSLGSLKWLNIAALVASRKADRQWSFD